MKAFLMHRDRDFDAGRDLPLNQAALTQDLELEHAPGRDGRRRHLPVRGRPGAPCC